MAEYRRYAISGAGTRAWKAYLPLFPDGVPVAPFGTLVGVADTDRSRLDAVTARWSVPAYPDVRAMLDATHPDVLVITTPDDAHARQIEQALAADVSVLVEKPLTVTAADAAAVLASAGRSRGSIRVAHNMRYLNLHREIRRLVADGHIGTPLRVDLHYRLAQGHGQSYFRRWHRRSAASGGLQITKSCHHFDMINWWLGDRPAEVTGWTRRAHYRPAGDGAGDGAAGELSVPADADIADELDAVIRYRGGAVAHYALSARAPWEGYTLTVHGTAGELTTRYEIRAAPGRELDPAYRVEVRALGGPVRTVDVPREEGSHSGADARMLAALVTGRDAGADPDAATAADGACAVATGEALTRSAATGLPVAVAPLLPEHTHERRHP